MQMQNWISKPRLLVVTLAICFGVIGLLITPQWIQAQSPSNWQFQLERMRVVQAQEDGFFEDGDEPYFIVVRFGARYRESGSAFVSWSRYLEEDWASGVEDNDERSIPSEMGSVSYDGMEIITRDHFSCENIMPEGGGALVIAMEHDSTPWNVIRDIMDDLQQSLDAELRNLVADGNLDLKNAEQEIRDAVARIVGAVSYDFWRSAEIVALSGGFPDDYINYHVFVFGAADPRVKAELAIPAIPQATIDVFSDRQFEPIFFEGDGAKYEVSSSLLATYIQPMAAVSSPEIQHPPQFVTGTPLEFAGIVAEGTDVTYDWDWGDGQTSKCANASHTYNQSGDYTIKVTASNRESEAETTISVTVVDSIVEAPTLSPQIYLPHITSSFYGR